MKKIISILLIGILFTMISACTNSSETESTKETTTKNDVTTTQEVTTTSKSYKVDDSQIASGYVRYDLKTPLKRLTEGVGAQFDTCIVDPYNNRITDWDLIADSVRLCNLQAVRIRFYPEMYERANDNDDPNTFDYDSPNVDFNSAEMQHLYQLLDLFEECHVNVDLSWYGCRTTFASEDGKYYGSWLGGRYGEDGIEGWMYAPSNKYTPNASSEFAESVASCLYYLMEVKGYTCLYEYSIFPEPEGVINDLNMYGDIASMIKTRLKNLGLDKKIKFSGPADYGNSATNLENKYLKGNYGYDKVDSSVYCFRGAMDVHGNTVTPSPNESMLNFAKEHVAVCDKYGVSWGIAESGTSNFITPVTNADTETYDRAMTMTRFFINLTNAGCTNFKYFVYSDCSYDGTVNEEGLFRFAKSYYNDSIIDYQAKPIWYAWSLIMRYTDIGSQIYPITDSYGNGEDDAVCITALKLPDGSWTYVMANISNETKKVAIVNENETRPESMKLFRLTASSIPFEEEATIKLIEKQKTIDTSNGIAYVNIPANGIIILSDKE